jgi:hypothetical protein
MMRDYTYGGHSAVESAKNDAVKSEIATNGDFGDLTDSVIMVCDKIPGVILDCEHSPNTPSSRMLPAPCQPSLALLPPASNGFLGNTQPTPFKK